MRISLSVIPSGSAGYFCYSHIMLNLIETIAIEKEARYERDQRIFAAHESGLSYAAIGRMFELSGSNVKDRIERLRRRQKIHESNDPFVKLAPKTFNLLEAHGLLTIEKVVDAYSKNKLLNIREFGCKRLREVEKWFPVSKN